MDIEIFSKVMAKVIDVDNLIDHFAEMKVREKTLLKRLNYYLSNIFLTF